MGAGDWTADVDDFKRLAALAKVDFSISEKDEAPDEEEDPTLDLAAFLEELAKAAISPDPDEFAEFVAANRDDVFEALAQNPSVADVILAGYRLGITFGSDACMNALGAHYYLGDIFEQDFTKAEELYQMAVDHGRTSATRSPPRSPPRSRPHTSWETCTRAARPSIATCTGPSCSGSAASSFPKTSSSAPSRPYASRSCLLTQSAAHGESMPTPFVR